jgi:hypothetical protein
MPLADLITQCQAERRGTAKNPDKSHRYLEALMYKHFGPKNAAKNLALCCDTLTESAALESPDYAASRMTQLLKDFETRHERRFTTKSVLPPAASSFAANHRTRRIMRRNLGEVSLVEAADTLIHDGKTDHVWLISHDQDLVSYEQYRGFEAKRHDQNAIMPKDANQSAGLMLHPQVAQQHSRFLRHVSLHAPLKDAAAANLPIPDRYTRMHIVPTQDFVRMMVKGFEPNPKNLLANKAHPDSQAFRAAYGL